MRAPCAAPLWLAKPFHDARELGDAEERGARELGRGSRLRLTIRAAWSPLILPGSDGLTSHPVVTVQLVHRATDPAVLTLPLGAVK